MTNIFLVRHGVTDHTGSKLSGWMEGIHLTAEGRRQAEAAADHLARTKFSAIYSSPIDRCRETAEVIANPHGMQIELTEGLGEVRYGAWTDRSFKSLVRTKLWQVVQTRPSAVRFPDGEAIREVLARAIEQVEEIAAAHPKGTVCCVSHADVIKLILAHYLGVHLDLFQRIAIAPASISGLSIDGPKVMVWAMNILPSPGPGQETPVTAKEAPRRRVPPTPGRRR